MYFNEYKFNKIEITNEFIKEFMCKRSFFKKKIAKDLFQKKIAKDLFQKKIAKNKDLL